MHFQFVIFDIVIATIIACIIRVCWNNTLGRLLSPRRFVEAVIEITPFGVQLISVFGTKPATVLAPSSLSSPLKYSTNAPPFNTTTTKYSSSGDVNDKKKHTNKIRAFIPKQQILDVVVMEVVWSHCVWSQVVFRVVKEDIGNMGHLKLSRNNLQCDTIQFAVENTGDGDGDGDDNVDSPVQPITTQRKNLPRKTSQCNTKTKTSLIQALLQQNQIAIVPAFPEECRGMLSYEQCLRIQAEIERMLE